MNNDEQIESLQAPETLSDYLNNRVVQGRGINEDKKLSDLTKLNEVISNVMSHYPLGSDNIAENPKREEAEILKRKMKDTNLALSVSLDSGKGLYSNLKIDISEVDHTVQNGDENTSDVIDAVLNSVISKKIGVADCNEYSASLAVESARELFLSQNRADVSIHSVNSQEMTHEWVEIRGSDGKERNDDIILDVWGKQNFPMLREDYRHGKHEKTGYNIDKESAESLIKVHDRLN
jgi:hypothetical protein